MKMNPLEGSRASQRKEWVISVRELVQFVWRRGDLGGSRKTASRSPLRAQQGSETHRKIQAMRPSDYQPEVPVEWVDERFGVRLRLRGRLDGLWPRESKIIVEEIKSTYRLSNIEGEPLHWAQAEIYGYLISQTFPAIETLEIRLTYAVLPGEEIISFNRQRSPTELAQFFEETVGVYYRWMVKERDRVVDRDKQLELLEFPFPEYRKSQKQIATATYKTIRDAQNLLIEAPTGLGKTMAVSFAVLKALAGKHLDRALFLTAKTTGQRSFMFALSLLNEKGAQIRWLSLTARDKICFTESPPCDLTTCPYALGFYDRLQGAMEAAASMAVWDRDVIESLAERFQLCPYALSLELVPWADVIVGDYNYGFHPGSRLSLAREKGDSDRVALLLDEAHNFPERARAMYSATLHYTSFETAWKEAKKDGLKGIASSLSRWLKHWPTIEREPGMVVDSVPHSSEHELTSLPDRFETRLRRVVTQVEAWLIQGEALGCREAIEIVWQEANDWLRLSDHPREDFIIVMTQGEDVALRRVCLGAEGLVAPVVEEATTTICFSGSLSPLSFFRRTILNDVPSHSLQLDSIFPKENLGVDFARISIRYRDRARTMPAVIESIRRFIIEAKGNYFVFTPSFEYMESLETAGLRSAVKADVIAQSKSMSDDEKHLFLQRFETPDQEARLIGLCVAGGSFAEGIDLVGDKLTGVIVIGVGLPGVGLEREAIRRRFEQQGLDGFDFAYRYPGLNRVIQAAGRLIRSESDQGRLLLIDDRYFESRNADLLPACWF